VPSGDHSTSHSVADRPSPRRDSGVGDAREPNAGNGTAIRGPGARSPADPPMSLKQPRPAAANGGARCCPRQQGWGPVPLSRPGRRCVRPKSRYGRAERGNPSWRATGPPGSCPFADNFGRLEQRETLRQNETTRQVRGDLVRSHAEAAPHVEHSGAASTRRTISAGRCGSPPIASSANHRRQARTPKG